MIQNQEFRPGSVHIVPWKGRWLSGISLYWLSHPPPSLYKKCMRRRSRKRERDKLTLGVVLNLSHNIIVISDVRLVGRLAAWLVGDTDSFRVISPVSSQYFQPPLSLNINGIFVEVSFIVPPTHSNYECHPPYSLWICHPSTGTCLVCLHPVLVQLSVCVTIVHTCPSGVFVFSRADVL